MNNNNIKVDKNNLFCFLSFMDRLTRPMFSGLCRTEKKN